MGGVGAGVGGGWGGGTRRGGLGSAAASGGSGGSGGGGGAGWKFATPQALLTPPGVCFTSVVVAGGGVAALRPGALVPAASSANRGATAPPLGRPRVGGCAGGVRMALLSAPDVRGVRAAEEVRGAIESAAAPALSPAGADPAEAPAATNNPAANAGAPDTACMRGLLGRWDAAAAAWRHAGGSAAAAAAAAAALRLDDGAAWAARGCRGVRRCATEQPLEVDVEELARVALGLARQVAGCDGGGG
ncbi:hypothetical protein I4F81_000385 [Pyropia yezoensis]|uniref:Uncharacterized protein n=1 Tax=Pyropia yezoensis TaxID=2788 RepID=A0ACC3BIL7_PYRYE|nr:hypothetical protein I4F81_000385 [Neopyropia yezoensis]